VHCRRLSPKPTVPIAEQNKDTSTKAAKNVGIQGGKAVCRNHRKPLMSNRKPYFAPPCIVSDDSSNLPKTDFIVSRCVYRRHVAFPSSISKFSHFLCHDWVDQILHNKSLLKETVEQDF
jgi:hypothetical protein